MKTNPAIESTEPPADELAFNIQMSECPDCRGSMIIYIGAYISWEECLSCRYSRLLGLSSYQNPALQLASRTH